MFWVTNFLGLEDMIGKVLIISDFGALGMFVFSQDASNHTALVLLRILAFTEPLCGDKGVDNFN
jgi:hypothetical protein